MKDGQSRGHQPDQIDFPALWVLVRGVQILLTVLYAKIAYLSFGSDSFALDLFSSVGMLTMIGVFVAGLPLVTQAALGFTVAATFASRLSAGLMSWKYSGLSPGSKSQSRAKASEGVRLYSF